MVFLIALGSNATSRHGDARETVAAALETLRERWPVGFAQSDLFSTPCFPAGAGPDFVNAACRFRSGDAPEQVLQGLHAIEAEFGRQRLQRWGQRTLDLDLIAAGDLVRPDRAGFLHWRDLPLEEQARTAPDDLILPHPRLQDRAFVLVPLTQIAPDWVHPVLETTTAAMLAQLPEADIAQVIAI